MPNVNVSGQGYITGTTETSQAAARDATTGTHTDATNQQDFAIQWFRSAGRGGGAMRYIRTFLYFDTSGITGTISSATLKILGSNNGLSGTNDNGHVIGVKSTAFGGDGGTSLASGDFDNIDYNTVYTDEIDNWILANSPTFNEFTLTSTALTDIKNNDAFIIAIVNHTSDYLDQDTSDGVFSNAINFSGITIDYTLAPTGYGNNVIGVPSANISTVNAVATANIEKIISA